MNNTIQRLPETYSLPLAARIIFWGSLPVTVMLWVALVVDWVAR